MASPLADVVAGMCEALGYDEIVLRAADVTTVLAGGAHVPRQPGASSGWVLDVPVRRSTELLGVLTVTAGRPFTESDARALSAVSELLALALAADPAATGQAAGQAVLDEEADRAQVATTLFEAVTDALVSVRYAAELVSTGQEDRSVLDEPVRVATAAVRQAYRDLRAHALEAGLVAALRELPQRLGGDRPHDGMPELRLSVDVQDDRLDALPPPIAVTVQRVAEAALRGAKGSARVRADYVNQTVKLRVDSADIAYDASELSRWARRATALGGDLRLRPGGVELSLPAELGPPSPALLREGRHDDGTDL